MRLGRTDYLLVVLCMSVGMTCTHIYQPCGSLVPASDQGVGIVRASAQLIEPPRVPDVPYVPTPPEVVAEMLRIANVKKDDVVYDLGCGDGRIVITAAQKYGTRGVGVDINPERITEAQANAQDAGVTDRVKFIQQDLFETDIHEATVVALYLLPSVNLKLRPKLLRELKPGTRIVSHAFDMGDWKPERVVQVDGRTIYYWVVPAGVTPKNEEQGKR